MYMSFQIFFFFYCMLSPLDAANLFLILASSVYTQTASYSTFLQPLTRVIKAFRPLIFIVVIVLIKAEIESV